ncbi:MAG: sulfatase-like hydrolase/transferase [Ectothiorhodospiraceae bacterium]|nr:sulfatase-like hydrolase/transferase [Chromatiales bacterium]MCP5157081.1 sulfatase-like hydrolase/transferase [Ectothiorhodospiraceae bacterium]
MPATDRPNILWLCTDQQRHDTIAALGQPHVRTPTIDRLVGEGTAFRRAYVQSQICTPSRASFLTGRYPASHHVHRNGNRCFPSGETLVTRLLADAGYDCGLVGKLHLSRAQGHEVRPPNDGYRVFQWSHHPLPDLDYSHHAYHRWLAEEKGVDAEALYARVRGAVCEGVPAELHQTTWAAEMAIRFITERREGPWCLSWNPFDPHPPFDPPAEYMARYDPESLPHPLFRDSDIERQRAFAEVAQQSIQAIDPRIPVDREQPDDALGTAAATRPPARFYGRAVKAAYYAMIELLDDQIARILDALEATGQRERTIVVFTSDHGEMLGDHGLIYKGSRFFEGLVHVPLVVSWPGEVRAGAVSDALVESIDIAPTLLEAAGLPVPSYMQGRSLLALLRGEGMLHEHRPHVVAEFNDALGSTVRPMPTHATMYFDGRYKSIVYHGMGLGELFDLASDPGEFDNLWDRSDARDLRNTMLARHFDAMMATSTAGIERTHRY